MVQRVRLPDLAGARFCSGRAEMTDRRSALTDHTRSMARTSLAELRARTQTCREPAVQAASQGARHQLCEADQLQRIQPDHESGTERARGTRALRSSSAQRSQFVDGGLTHPVRRSGRAVSCEFRFRALGPDLSSRHRPVPGPSALPPFPLFLVESRSCRLVKQTVLVLFTHSPGCCGPARTWPSYPANHDAAWFGLEFNFTFELCFL